jgi:adenylate cyclase
MAAPSEQNRFVRVASRAYRLLEVPFQSLAQHRISFLISIVITFAALALYYFTFFGYRPTTIFTFLQRLEFDSLDARFRYRPRSATPIDPAILIIDIDQQSEEVFGRWPFSHTYFATLLDTLHTDGAAVAAFDATFTKPEVSAEPIRVFEKALQAHRKKIESVDPQLAAELRNLAANSEPDEKFAAAISRFGNVVLGNFFLYTKADLRDLSPAVLDAYAKQLSFFGIPEVEAVKSRTEFGKQDRANLIAKFQRENLLPKGGEANLDLFTNALGGSSSGIGFFNVPSDIDGVVRTTALVIPFGPSDDLSNVDFYGSLAVMTVRAYLGVHDDLLLTFGQTGIKDLQFGNKLAVTPNDIGQALINYHGPANTYPHYSMADIVEGKFPPGLFRGKIVLIGATATGIGDIKATPVTTGTDYPGVEIHANVIDNLLHNNFLLRGAKQQLVDFLTILLLGLPLGIFMALVQPRFMYLGIGLLVPLVWVDYAAFLHGWWLNFSVPAITITSNVLLVSLYRALVEEKEKRKVRGYFSQFVSPEVVNQLLLDPRLVEPRKTEISVMFSDIRGFTTISEQLDAQELAQFLNEYLSDMSAIVLDKLGTVDKFIGDAVMAFWGAPVAIEAPALKACDSALQMMVRVREIQTKWEAQGRPHLDIGIGINTGNASVGNMGSAQRYAYTALGDTVNLASRLEGLNKDYGTHIIVNESTYASVSEGGLLFRELDLIRVKGKTEPVTIYELIGRAGELSVYGEPEDLEKRLAAFRQARELYTQRQWEAAQKAFETILAKWDGDGPSRTYWKRCQEYLFDEPPSGWDGVFTMTHK